MTDTIRTDVAIVGGGLAGLTAAVALRDSGLSTLVVEEDSILGGRARSWIDEKTGDPVHIGPHIFLSEYPNMRKLLGLLGTEDRLVWQRGRFIFMVDGRSEIEFRMARLPAPFQFIPSLLADPAIRHRDLASNVPVSLFALRLTEHDIERLDNVNASAVLRSLGVTERFIQRFWAFTSMAIMNVPLELCSAGALFRFYRRLIGHTRYDVGFPDGGLGDLFAPQAKALIERSGGRIMLGARVVTFTGDATRATGLELADGRRVEARFCIAALPPSALRRIARPEWLPGPVFRDLVRFQPCPYVSTYLWFDRKLTRRQFWARVHDPNDLNCDFYDLSNINRGWESRPSLITTNCIFCERAAGMSDEQIVQGTVRELSEYLPEAARAKLVHWVVNRIPMAIHCPFPGTEQRRPTLRPGPKNLLLAGDWIRTRLPSSMESACMAGWQAAEAVLADLGRPASLAVPHKDIDGVAGLLYRTTRWAPVPHLPGWVRATGRIAA
ncbi:MAG: FAD-dependent oxidoreductase [Deltaproteobacteria bacterium]|nr:FAD-dependent oxidoreductase [Deltaproteobacteria bacterium]